MRAAVAAGAPLRLAARARRRGETPVVIGFDVEPDPRTFHPDEPPPWAGLEALLERVPDLRRHLAGITGAPVAFTWFVRMDPQVERTWGSAGWVLESYRDVLDDLVSEGDELGLHTHTWRWVDERGLWIAEYEDAEWVDHCLTLGLDTYEAVLGRPCPVFRGGDYYLDGAMLARLIERGVAVDVTVEPGRPPQSTPSGEATHGILPDYRDVPRRPYRSSPARFPAADPTAVEGPLLLPIYSPPSLHGASFPIYAESTVGRFQLRMAAGLLREPPGVIAATARSDAPLSPRWDALTVNLEHLARHGGMRFVTASAAAALNDSSPTPGR